MQINITTKTCLLQQINLCLNHGTSK